MKKKMSRHQAALRLERIVRELNDLIDRSPEPDSIKCAKASLKLDKLVGRLLKLWEKK